MRLPRRIIPVFALLSLVVTSLPLASASITSSPGTTQLAQGSQVRVNGSVQTYSSDTVNRAGWVGNQYFVDVTGNGGNQLHAILEFYFFMSSSSKASDFYVVRILSKTTPNPNDGNWRLDSSGVDDRNGPANKIYAKVDTPAAIRWDWNDPWTTMDFTLNRLVTVTETYSVSGSVEAEIFGCIEVACGSTKGTIDAGYQLTNQYTVALYLWTIRPSGGSLDFQWSLGLNQQGLPAERNEGVQEVFLVLTTGHQQTISLNNIQLEGHLWSTAFCFLCTIVESLWTQINSITLNYYGLPPQCTSCCSGCGGGGSIADGALVTMADGTTIPVQNLKVGDRMLGYDLGTGKFTASTVLDFKKVVTSNMLIINTEAGTPFRVDANERQTLYTKRDDGSIQSLFWLPVTQTKPGDYLFTPNGWVKVTSVQFAPAGQHTMYDIVATVPYFASGYLDPIYKM